MKKRWLISILIISLALLGSLKSYEFRSLTPFFKPDRPIPLARFEASKKLLSSKDQDLLELWESILTGRSAPLSSWMKDRYRRLGINHLFTPSGFHLSAILWPFMKFFKSTKAQLSLLGIIAFFLSFFPGQAALKRMVVIKSHQQVMGQRIGFLVALTLDILFGSFQNAPLSFSYSFLFLGIIYSGLKGIGLLFWFFVAQIILSFFQGVHISPFIFLFSPLLNLGFSLAMPVLFLLALPLWEWQLHVGLSLLSILQSMVDLSAKIISHVPVWEIHCGFILVVTLFLFRRWKTLGLILLILTNSLNLDLQKAPAQGTYEFQPQKDKLNILLGQYQDSIYFKDGKCERKLVRGFWWEKCSPKRRSTKKTKKSSYPS